MSIKLYIKQQVFTWLDRFYIKDADASDKYYAKGELSFFLKRLNVYDMGGQRLARITQEFNLFMPTFVIAVNEQTVCRIVKKFQFFRNDYYVEGLPWELEGDFWAHEYSLYEGGLSLMYLSKKWFTWGDSYELHIADPQNELICLCIALAIDCAMAASGKRS
jgi:uncharacterized protein YxjI